jgi:hypothetical protein
MGAAGEGGNRQKCVFRPFRDHEISLGTRSSLAEKTRAASDDDGRDGDAVATLAVTRQLRRRRRRLSAGTRQSYAGMHAFFLSSPDSREKGEGKKGTGNEGHVKVRARKRTPPTEGRRRRRCRRRRRRASEWKKARREWRVPPLPPLGPR